MVELGKLILLGSVKILAMVKGTGNVRWMLGSQVAARGLMGHKRGHPSMQEVRDRSHLLRSMGIERD